MFYCAKLKNKYNFKDHNSKKSTFEFIFIFWVLHGRTYYNIMYCYDFSAKIQHINLITYI